MTPEMQRAIDVAIATKVYGWYERTFTLVRGRYFYEGEEKDFPIETGAKVVLLVPANFSGDTTLWWHEYDTSREKNVPHYTTDYGLAVKLMMRTTRWGWRWFLDMDESRCAIRLVPDPQEKEIVLIGLFAEAICLATVQALNIEVQTA